jgi:hypothetical protein
MVPRTGLRTEALRRLTFKISGYDRLAKETRIHTPVLIWTTTLRREARLREVLAETLRNLDDPVRVPVATTAADLAEPDQHLDATLTRWLPLTARYRSPRPGPARRPLATHRQAPDRQLHSRQRRRASESASPAPADATRGP